MTMLCQMDRYPFGGARSSHGGRTVRGTCPQCGKTVYESLWRLDDAFAVWAGQCPHCNAISFLDQSAGHGRGYDSATMDLVLPTAEEVQKNGLPADTPTRPWPPTKEPAPCT